MRMQNMVAVVTGAQQGIGKAIAEAFAREGAGVVINYLDDRDGALGIVSDITAAGGKAEAVQGSVASADCIEKMMRAAESFGRLTTLVNNAGIFPRVGFLDMTEADWDRVHDVNLKAGFFCAQAAAKRMKTAGHGGAIINLASAAAYSGPALGVHYAASKGGVIGMTRAMAMALAPFGIRANAIAPGLTDTAQPRDGHSEGEIAEFGARLPLGRICQPHEIADAAVFLASNESRQMTGQVLHINAGQYFH